VISVALAASPVRDEARRASEVHGGKAWTFVDTGSGGGDTLRKIFPRVQPGA